MSEELVQLQKELFDAKKEIVTLKAAQKLLEAKVEKDVKEIRIEAEKVLEKVSALVNPYSTRTMTWDK